MFSCNSIVSVHDCVCVCVCGFIWGDLTARVGGMLWIGKYKRCKMDGISRKTSKWHALVFTCDLFSQTVALLEELAKHKHGNLLDQKTSNVSSYASQLHLILYGI